MKALRNIALILCVVLIFSVFPVSAAEIPNAFWKLNDAYNAAISSGNDAAVRDNARAIVKLFEGRWDSTAVSISSSRYFELGMACERLGDYNGARDAFEKSVPYYEKYPSLGLGDPTESLTIIKNKIQLFTPTLELYRTYYGYQTYFGAINEKRMGILWGAAVDGKVREKTPHESFVLIYQEFGTPDSGFNAAKLREAEESGIAVEFALNLPGEGSQLSQVLLSRDYIMDVIALLKTVDVPVFLRFGAEMDTWAIPADPAAYIAAFRYVADLVHENTDHVAMVWSPTCTSPWLVDVNTYYPGDEYVDWVGVSLYLTKHFLGKTNWTKQEKQTLTSFYPGDAAEPVRVIEHLINLYGDRKPFIISESGVSHSYRILDGKPVNTNETEWAINRLRMLYKYLPMAYPQIKAIAHFDKVMSAEVCDFALYTNDRLTNEYLTLITDDAFIQNSYDNEANATYQKLTPTFDAEQGYTELRTMAFFYGKDNITVAYSIDGKQIASSSTLPYTVGIDLSGYAVGNHTVTVSVFSEFGIQLAQQKYTMRLSKAADVYVNGEYLTMPGKPVIVEGTTLVPLRAIVEKLGGAVEWIADTKSIIITSGNNRIELRIGSYDMITNGNTSTLLVPARLINSTTYIPLRAVAEAMEADVKWNGNIKRIDINR